MRVGMTWLSLALLMIALFGGCNRSKPAEEIGLGSLDGKTYSHQHFNFQITFPDDWYIMGEAEQKELMEAGKRFATSGNKQLEAAAQAAESQTLTLVSAFQHPPGTPVPSNSNIIIMAERVAHAPGIKSGADYLAHMQNTLRQTGMQPQFQPVERNQPVGSLTMDVLPMEMNVMLQTVRQRHHATRIKDYVLVIAVSHAGEEDLRELTEILNTIRPAK